MTVEAAVKEWLEFRSKNQLGNTKAKLLGDKLVAWCKEHETITKPLASQTPIETNAIIIPSKMLSGPECRSWDSHIEIANQNVAPPSPAARHCRFIPYTLAPSRVRGRVAPFATNNQRMATAIRVTTAIWKRKLVAPCMV